jgi:hypothetical protein
MLPTPESLADPWQSTCSGVLRRAESIGPRLSLKKTNDLVLVSGANRYLEKQASEMPRAAQSFFWLLFFAFKEK